MEPPLIPTPYTEFTRIPNAGWIYRMVNAGDNPNLTAIAIEAARTCRNLNRVFVQKEAQLPLPTQEP